jgi:DNA-binding transcriptional ArsR family regulator
MMAEILSVAPSAKVSQLASQLFTVLANETRFELLSILVSDTEANVMTLAQKVNTSQSALSQHLAKMRDIGIVSTRREGQSIYYRISSPIVENLIRAFESLIGDKMHVINNAN